MNEAPRTAEITVTRIFDAPLDLVFRSFTEAEHLARWWGPEGYSAPLVESDPTTGGALKIVMRSPEGFDSPMVGKYLEVVAPERIAVSASPLDPEGNAILEATNIVTFEDLGGKTQVTVHASATAIMPGSENALSGMQAGWKQSLQRLDDVLTGAVGRLLLYTRMYEAPREKVYELWTRPEHVMKWWGPDGFTTTIDEMNVRPGGRWKLTMHGPDGTDYPNTIIYDEVIAPERLVFTLGEPGDPDPQFTFIVTFEEFMGNTVLSMRHVFNSAQSRDAVVEKHLAIEGANQTLDRLTGYLESQSAQP